MHRFFSHTPLSSELVITSGDQFHQIMYVFRAKKGDSLIFFENRGDDIVYCVTQVDKKSIILHQKEVIKKQIRKERTINIFLAYPNKVSTAEFVVQKIVELGISDIIFFASDRSQMKSISDAKKARLTSIATEALEQSGGNIPLKILYSSENMDSLWEMSPHNIVGSIGETEKITLPGGDDSLGFWVGPEGGWSESEKEFFTSNMGCMWSFNSRTLRLETASIVGVGLLKYLANIAE